MKNEKKYNFKINSVSPITITVKKEHLQRTLPWSFNLNSNPEIDILISQEPWRRRPDWDVVFTAPTGAQHTHSNSTGPDKGGATPPGGPCHRREHNTCHASAVRDKNRKNVSFHKRFLRVSVAFLCPLFFIFGQIYCRVFFFQGKRSLGMGIVWFRLFDLASFRGICII